MKKPRSEFEKEPLEQEIPEEVAQGLHEKKKPKVVRKTSKAQEEGGLFGLE